MRSDVVPGGKFPDYELPGHTNTPFRLSELQGEDPLILTPRPGARGYRRDTAEGTTASSAPNTDGGWFRDVGSSSLRVATL